MKKNRKNRMLLIMLSCLCVHQFVGATREELVGPVEAVLGAIGLIGIYYMCSYGSVYGIKLCCAVLNERMAPVLAPANERFLQAIERDNAPVAPENNGAILVPGVASRASLQDLPVERDRSAVGAVLLLDDVSDVSNTSNLIDGI